MTEVIKTLATIFSSVSIAETAVFLLYCLFACGGYFLFQVWFPEYLKSKHQENEREDKKIEIFDATQKQIIATLEHNSVIIDNFNHSISALDNTLDKISDKLHTHDAKVENIKDNVKILTKEVSRFKENTPTLRDINRIHQRIDEIKNNLSNKQDVNLIIHKLDQILEAVSQIQGKMM